MSENKDINSAEVLSAITFADLTEFVTKRVKNHLCQCCGTNDWTAMGGPEHFLVLVGLGKDGSFSLPPPSIPTFCIECKNCGYIRSHALARVADWKLSGKA